MRLQSYEYLMINCMLFCSNAVHYHYICALIYEGRGKQRIQRI